MKNHKSLGKRDGSRAHMAVCAVVKSGLPQRPILKLVFALGLAIALLSCGAQGSSFDSLIPKDALMVIYSPDPLGLIRNADDFARASGLVGFLGGASPSETLFAMAKMDQVTALELFDLDRPSGAYVSGSLATSPAFTLLIAVRDPEKAKTWIASSFGPGFAVDGPHAGYLAVRPASQVAHSWKGGSTLKPGTLPTRAGKRLMLCVNYEGLLNDPALAARSSGSGMPATTEGMRELLSAMDWVSLGIGADETAFSMSLDTRADPDSPFGQALRGLRAGKPSWADLLAADEVFGIASNVSSGGVDRMGESVRSMFSTFGIDRPDEAAEAYLGLMRASGGDMYVSIDVEAKGAVSGSNGLGGIALSAGGVADLRDEAAFRRDLSLALDGLVQMYSSLLASAYPDLSLSLATTPDQDGPRGAIRGYRLMLQASPAPGESGLDTLASIDAALDIGEGRVAFGVGDERLALLESFRNEKPASAPLKAVPGYDRIAAYLDPDPAIVGHLSVARLGNVIGAILGLPLSLDERAAGLLFSVSYAQGSVRMDAVLGAAELGEFVLGLLSLSAPRSGGF